MPKPRIIAIDGPASAGKSTLGARLAQVLGYLYVDTGVMYRAVTWEALCQDIPIEDEAAITALAAELSIDITRPQVEDGRQYTVYVDGRDVTWDLRRPEVDQQVSPVSAYSGVRRVLTAQQRAIGLRGEVVMVGRDIGTVVLPEAALKIYLDASPEERARRRLRDKQALGCAIDYETVLLAIRRRDRYDAGRTVAPLRQAEDAIYMDNDHMTIEEELQFILELLQADEAVENDRTWPENGESR
ncbi:MAG: (d)CMP kinase [Chloroflexia bacterium]|nr:(d)CMP kinase [Chloroflexia bacterium]